MGDCLDSEQVQIYFSYNKDPVKQNVLSTGQKSSRDDFKDQRVLCRTYSNSVLFMKKGLELPVDSVLGGPETNLQCVPKDK